MEAANRPAEPLAGKAEELVEIRWHGRGGQGVVTAGELLAEAALLEGKYFQSFPEFGAERSGAPVTAYTRISPSPIDIQSAVVEPEIVVVLDPTLPGQVDTFSGLPDRGGTVIINSSLSPGEIQAKYSLEEYAVYTVDADRIAMELLHRQLPNTPILGALLRGRGLVSIGKMMRCIRRRLGGRLPAETLDANIGAFKRGYRETRSAPPRSAYGSYVGPGRGEWTPGASTERWQELSPGGIVVEPGSTAKLQTGTWRSSTPKLDLEKCTHCMICWIFCPDDSIIVNDLRVEGIDLLHCKGCGICATECPVKAITMEEQAAPAVSGRSVELQDDLGEEDR